MDSLQKIETAISLLRRCKEAAYKAGYAEGSFGKHLSTLSPEEIEAVTAAAAAFLAMKGKPAPTAGQE